MVQQEDQVSVRDFDRFDSGYSADLSSCVSRPKKSYCNSLQNQMIQTMAVWNAETTTIWYCRIKKNGCIELS